MHWKEAKDVKSLFEFSNKLSDQPDLYKRWTQYCLEWYIRKANTNKQLYYALSTIKVLFASET